LPAIIHSLNVVIFHSRTAALPHNLPGLVCSTFALSSSSKKAPPLLRLLRLQRGMTDEPFNVKQKTSLALRSCLIASAASVAGSARRRLNDVRRYAHVVSDDIDTNHIRSA